MYYGSIFLLIVMNLLTASVYGSGKPVRVLGAGEGSGFMSAYHQTEGTSVKLFCDTTYILTGLYYVDSLATLEIQQGVTILGDSATGGTLIVQRGGQIFAEGSVEHPILFTGRKPAGERMPGDWAGIIIAGSATSNQSSDNGMLAGLGVAFGGANDEYSAGHFHYVRVEYAGMELLPSHSGAGITLAGLGKETELHHIQVSYSKGNGVNIFGGIYDAEHIFRYGERSSNNRRWHEIGRVSLRRISIG